MSRSDDDTLHGTTTLDGITFTLGKLADALLEPISAAVDYLYENRQDIDSSILPDLAGVLNQLSSTLLPSTQVFRLNYRSGLAKNLQDKINALLLWAVQMQSFLALEALKLKLAKKSNSMNYVPFGPLQPPGPTM